MEFFRMGWNWKMLVGVAMIAGALYFSVSPGTLPFLLVGMCLLPVVSMRLLPHGHRSAQPELALAYVPVKPAPRT